MLNTPSHKTDFSTSTLRDDLETLRTLLVDFMPQTGPQSDLQQLTKAVIVLAGRINGLDQSVACLQTAYNAKSD